MLPSEDAVWVGEELQERFRLPPVVLAIKVTRRRRTKSLVTPVRFRNIWWSALIPGDLERNKYALKK